MFKARFFLLLAILILAACKEESLVDENPPTGQNNITVNFNAFYGDTIIRLDSTIYQTRFGDRFFIDSLTLMLSNLAYTEVNSDDTIDKEPNYVVFRQSNKNAKGIMRLPAGGYNGKFFGISGIDMFELITDTVDGVPAFSDIDGIDGVKRQDGFGYYQFQVFGRYFDNTNPMDTVGSKKFSYQIGGFGIDPDTINSNVRAFSVDNRQNLRLNLILNIKPSLANININQRPKIETRFGDFQDIEAAKLFRDSLDYGIF